MTEASLAIVASVLMHVTWNLLARQQPREVFALWWVLLAHLILLAPWGLYTLLTEVTWTLPFALLLAISAAANALYFFGLKQAYQHAPVSVVYPLVRSSPVLIAVWSYWLFGEKLGSTVWIGMVVSVIGLIILAATSRNGSDRIALPWAALAMLSTSVYSLSDKAASTHIESFGGLLGFISFGYFAAWAALTVQLRITEKRWVPLQRLRPSLMVIGGLSVGLAYVLVIHAMRAMPAAVVVTFTNAGIVLATLASVILFRERTFWRWRVFAAIVVTTGLAFMASA